MSISGHDVYNSLKAQFPHARVDKIEQSSRAKMTAERGQKRKRSEEAKWTDGEYGRYDRTRHKHSIGWDTDHPWWVTVLVCKTELPENTKMKSNEPDYFEERKCAKCEKRIWKHVWHPEDGKTLVCEKCRVSEGLFYSWEVKESHDYRRKIESMTRKHLGGMELLNENLSGQMQKHGDPAYVAHLRETGQLQIRKDQNGNPCEYLVSSSRRQQAEQLKQYNRSQHEAEARGWGGTRSSRGIVRKINHGGLTPD